MSSPQPCALGTWYGGRIMIDPGLRGRVALITGANHGIGAAAAQALAAEGVAVFLSYLRVETAGHGDPALPPEYDEVRAHSADAILAAIRQAGGRASAWEANLADPAVVPQLFDRVDTAFGPVEILVNNAAFWHGDTYVPDRAERFDWRLMPVSAAACDRHFAVNSRAPALLNRGIRAAPRRARSKLGTHPRTHHWRRTWLSRRSIVRR